MFELIGAIIAGIVLGIITGLLPGIHINLVMTVLAPVVMTYTSLTPLTLALSVSALAATHTVIDFIPSIYVGAPEAETALSVLPAHQLLLEGKGHEATLIVISGVVCGLIALGITSLALIYAVPLIEEGANKIIPFLLIGISGFMILREEYPLRGTVIFLSAGFLGYGALNTSVSEPLFPLLTGLFGMSGIVMALKQKENIPPQKEIGWSQIEITRKDWRKTIRDVITIGLPCSILPALGSGYASLIASEITTPNNKRFLMISSAMNMYTMGASFFIVYSLGKARTGAAAIIGQILPELTLGNILVLVAVLCAVTLIACKIAEKTSSVGARIIGRINYRKLSIMAIVFLIVSVIVVSGLRGLLIMGTGTALGIYTLLSENKRMHLMGCLLVPTIIYYLV